MVDGTMVIEICVAEFVEGVDSGWVVCLVSVRLFDGWAGVYTGFCAGGGGGGFTIRDP